MKTWYNMLIIIGISLVFIINLFQINLPVEEKGAGMIESEVVDKNKFNKTEVKIITKDELLKMNSRLESNGKWNVANKYGYMGKYQIGKLALIDLGYDTAWVNKLQESIYMIPDTVFTKKDTIVRKFYYFDLTMFPPKKQEEVIKKLLNKNETVYLRKHIKKYVGKEISGVRITKAGILSASFLGFGYVDKFLTSNGKINPSDANGHSIKERFLHFENYELK
ncbi:MAG: hypothetical protein RLZZ546_546 [Bacteroidota bacterium]|jgi:hypothetical protein